MRISDWSSDVCSSDLALCIDACDNVMDKIGKPRGLIAYATLNEYETNMALATDGRTTPVNPDRVRNPDGSFIDAVRHFDWRIIFRPRTLFYTGKIGRAHV